MLWQSGKTMDFVTTAVTTGAGVVVTGMTYLIGRVIDADKRLTAHEASDMEALKAIAVTLSDLKTSQRDQTQKLDRIVEHLLPPKGVKW